MQNYVRQYPKAYYVQVFLSLLNTLFPQFIDALYLFIYFIMFESMLMVVSYLDLQRKQNMFLFSLIVLILLFCAF